MNQENLSSFVQLFTLTDADATQRVSERLALALRAPAAYQEQFADELEQRDIVDAVADLMRRPTFTIQVPLV